MSDDDVRAPGAVAGEPAASNTEALSRRKALGRMVAYTAPAMLALLMGERHAAASYQPG